MLRKFNHIELFAGCGGMSLGLEATGFKLYMANELSPMASETFAYNFFGEDLSKLAKEEKTSQNTLWIKSMFSRDNLKDRLRENPFNFLEGEKSDITNKTNFKEKLIVGNIDHLLKFFAHNKSVCLQFRKQDIDLLSGGPPCQGFSLAGKRVKNDYKNLLPLSFAKFAGIIQPKVVLLENVKGITSPFKTDDGIKHYAWLEVSKAFALKGFFPVCMLVNSKYFGVPQNRPRFILFAFRKDVFEKLMSRKSNSEQTNTILSKSQLFYNKVHSKRKQLDLIKPIDIPLYDIEATPDLFNGDFLPMIKTDGLKLLNAKDAINDIASTKLEYKIGKTNNKFALHLLELFKPKFNNDISIIQNHEHRNHTFKVRARFRVYQVLSNLNGLKRDGMNVISGKCHIEEVFQKVYTAFKEEPLLIKTGEKETFEKTRNLDSFKEYLKQIESKKHSQRAIKSNEPAPAQMTIPDDLCHYSIDELRTLTVREMARFQSFPDWFVFKSKVTTGGNQRRFEVPQYTQVGNAVPPLLAYELGKTVSNLLKTID